MANDAANEQPKGSLAEAMAKAKRGKELVEEGNKIVADAEREFGMNVRRRGEEKE
jgi:hypothetical protein